jgi:DNA-binding transcriptional regulator LsrR (DeoR family)
MSRTTERATLAPRIKRRRLSPPVEFGGDPAVWAAWLYYEERMTQEEIADQLGVSRATIVNLLQEARDRGVVTIAVASQHMRSVRIAQELSRTFGLASCMVVPNDGGRTPSYERIGHAGARLLQELLQPDDVLGVLWGRTVLALSAALAPAQMPGVSVVQVAGSALGTAEFSPELCTSNIAHRLGARCINLLAPGIVSSPKVRQLFMQEPTLIETFRILKSCSKVLFGVGEVGSAGTAMRSGYLTPATIKPYLERGAIGVLGGRFVGRDGRPVLGAMDEQMIGLTIEEIARIPERICVAGGQEKVEAIHAVLRGGYATVLVTDEETALALGSQSRGTRGNGGGRRH